MYNIQTTQGASTNLQPEGLEGQRSTSSGDIFLQMRAARTVGVFRGADLEGQKYGHISKTINPKFESNLPTQLVINPVDIYPNDFSSLMARGEQLALPFCDDIYQALKNTDKRDTACHKVFSTKLITGSNVALLNIGGYYPNQLLTVVIKGRERNKLTGELGNRYNGKNIFVTGKLINYKGKAQIVVSDPEQIQAFNN